MNEIYNITFTQTSLACQSIALILLVLLPFAVYFAFKKTSSKPLKLSYLFLGALGFLISSRVLEGLVHSYCLVQDNAVSRFLNSNTLGYVLYGALMAGIFEECSRYLVMRFLLKKNRSIENAVMYGIGHGGIEVLFVVLPSILMGLVISVYFSAGQYEAVFSALQINESTVQAALPVILAASRFGVGMLILTVLERIFAMVLHIALSVLVFEGVVRSRISNLCLAISLHALVDVFAALYQRSVLPLWLTEILIFCSTVLVCFLVFRNVHGKKESNA